MAIRRIAPIKKKKTLAINSSGSLFVSTSRKDDDKRNPRVYIASSSPSVPLTELKFNELDAEKKEQYNLLFNQEIDPVGFINVFQNVVSNNLLQSVNKDKDTVLEEIDNFINDTAEVLVVAISQQNILFTPDEIQQKQSDLDEVVETIVQAQVQTTSLGDGVVATSTSSTKADTQKLQEIIEAEAKAKETAKLDPKSVKVTAPNIKEYSKAVSSLKEFGFRQVSPDLWVGPSGEEVNLATPE
jgi:hypothetical protein